MAKRKSVRESKKQKKRSKSHFKENSSYISYLATLSPKRQKNLIKRADKETLFALSEVCLNIMRRHIPLSDKEKNKLRPYAKHIYELSLKKPNLKQRRQIVQKGGFLASLLGSVVPILLSTVLAAKR